MEKKWIQKGKEYIAALRNKRTKKAAVIFGCLILGSLLVFISFTVYSKYYKTGYNKGMATASGFYFSSNYLVDAELSEIKTIEELAARTDLLDSLPVTANNTVWSGDSFHFSVDIRNYTNQLLYNDIDLNVSYQVEFLLIEEPQGAGYEVRKGTAGSYKPLTKTASAAEKAVFEGTLEGGRLTVESYDLKVTLQGASGDAYVPAKILMLAYPTAPSYLVDTKKIAGIITADYNQKEMEITEQSFTVDKDGFTDSTWKDIAKKESALVYQIKTTGNYSGGSSDNIKRKIKVSWNPGMYELNQNDKYKNDADTVYDEAGGTMIIETMPYASIKFVFFKKTEFDAKLDGGMSLEEFRKTVTAEIID